MSKIVVQLECVAQYTNYSFSSISNTIINAFGSRTTSYLITIKSNPSMQHCMGTHLSYQEQRVQEIDLNLQKKNNYMAVKIF